MSRKLEVQTQRLELLTSQSMVNENISTKQPDSRAVYENTPYADEGDEVTYVHFTVVWLCELIIVCMSSARHLYILMSILKS